MGLKKPIASFEKAPGKPQRKPEKAPEKRPEKLS